MQIPYAELSPPPSILVFIFLPFNPQSKPKFGGDLKVDINFGVACNTSCTSSMLFR